MVALGAAVLVLAGCGGSPEPVPTGSPADATSPATSAPVTPVATAILEQAPPAVTDAEAPQEVAPPAVTDAEATSEVVPAESDSPAPLVVPDPLPRSVQQQQQQQQQAPAQSVAPPSLPDPGFEPRAGY